MPPDTRVRPGETPQPDAGGFPGDAPASLARGDGRRTYSVRVSTAAQHQRDHAAAYAGRIRKDILAGLDAVPEPDADGRGEAIGRLVALSGELLRAETALDDAERRVELAALEERHAATQRAAVYLAVAPLLVAMVTAALVLFGAFGAGWLILAAPLFGAALGIAFAPLRHDAEAVRLRRRAGLAGNGGAGLTVLAIMPWPSVAVSAVLSVPAILAVAAAVVILVHEFRPEGGVR